MNHYSDKVSQRERTSDAQSGSFTVYPLRCGKSRIGLRAVTRKDLELLLRWKNDSEIEYLSGEDWDFPLSMERQEIWYEEYLKDSKNIRFMLDVIKDKKTVGYTGFWNLDWKNRKAHTGLVIGDRSARGKGYGVEAIFTIMEYAFLELNLHRLYGKIAEYNTASYKVYVEKCGWKKEGVLEDDFYRRGKYYNTIKVAILKPEFLRLRKKMEDK